MADIVTAIAAVCTALFAGIGVWFVLFDRKGLITTKFGYNFHTPMLEQDKEWQPRKRDPKQPARLGVTAVVTNNSPSPLYILKLRLFGVPMKKLPEHGEKEVVRYRDGLERRVEIRVRPGERQSVELAAPLDWGAIDSSSVSRLRTDVIMSRSRRAVFKFSRTDTSIVPAETIQQEAAIAAQIPPDKPTS